MGIDQRLGDKGRPDTIMLVSLGRDGKAVVLSIPRDTLVEIPGHGDDKVNHSYTYGGASLTMETVSRFLGVRIDGYALADLDGFAQIVDALGGLTIDVEKRMYYDDSTQNLHIDLQPGVQKLDGQQALNYVRFRDDGLGDIGRVAREQKFVAAVVRECLAPANLLRLPGVIRQAYQSVETDLPLTQALGLVQAVAKLSPDEVELKVLPGKGEYLNGVSYYVPDDLDALKADLRVAGVVD